MPTDPIDAMMAAFSAANDQNMAFYTEHLDELVATYRAHLAIGRMRYDRDALLNNMIKALMESDNTREALCYQVVIAVDRLARRS